MNIKSSILKNLFALSGAILFAIFCSLQFNDTVQFQKYGASQLTTILWIIGYTLISALCLTHLFYRISRPLSLTIFSIAIVLAAIRATSIDWTAPLVCITSPPGSTTYHPAGNETGGLLIIASWMILIYATGKPYRASTKETPLRPGNTDKSI